MYNGFNAAAMYDLECIILGDDGDDLYKKRFYAREYAPRTANAGYVAGGIASGGQNYMIATANDLVLHLNANASRIYVGNHTYRLTSVIEETVNISGGRGYGRAVKKEYVLTLE